MEEGREMKEIGEKKESTEKFRRVGERGDRKPIL